MQYFFFSFVFMPFHFTFASINSQHFSFITIHFPLLSAASNIAWRCVWLLHVILQFISTTNAISSLWMIDIIKRIFIERQFIPFIFICSNSFAILNALPFFSLAKDKIIFRFSSWMHLKMLNICIIKCTNKISSKISNSFENS